MAAWGLSLGVEEWGLLSNCGAGTYSGGISAAEQSQALGLRASVVVMCGLSSFGSQALEHRLSSCRAWA